MKDECLICKAPLEYLESDELVECAICHRKENTKTRCVNGHYVCNECHMAGMDAIIGLCLRETSKNPVEVIEKMMALPFCHMHGPEHHVMVGAVLLTAYKNAGGDIDLAVALTEMMNRGKERARRRLRLLGRLRRGHQLWDVCFHHLQIHTTRSGTFRAFPQNDGKVAGNHWGDRRAQVLQEGFVPLHPVGDRLCEGTLRR